MKIAHLPCVFAHSHLKFSELTFTWVNSRSVKSGWVNSRWVLV